MNNQRVEAQLRTLFEQLADDPQKVLDDPVGAAPFGDKIDCRCSMSTLETDDGEEGGTSTAATPSSWELTAQAVASPIFANLWQNYKRLYAWQAVFNVWTWSMFQGTWIAPFAVFAPLIFADDAHNRVTIGQVRLHRSP